MLNFGPSGVSSVTYSYNKNTYPVVLGPKNGRNIRDFELQLPSVIPLIAVTIIPLIAVTKHRYSSKFIFHMTTLLFIIWFLFTTAGVLCDCGVEVKLEVKLLRFIIFIIIKLKS